MAPRKCSASIHKTWKTRRSVVRCVNPQASAPVPGMLEAVCWIRVLVSLIRWMPANVSISGPRVGRCLPTKAGLVEKPGSYKNKNDIFYLRRTKRRVDLVPQLSMVKTTFPRKKKQKKYEKNSVFLTLTNPAQKDEENRHLWKAVDIRFKQSCCSSHNLMLSLGSLWGANSQPKCNENKRNDRIFWIRIRRVNPDCFLKKHIVLWGDCGLDCDMKQQVQVFLYHRQTSSKTGCEWDTKITYLVRM